jgi:uncharacterized protein YndB with AHSA1/START domain
MTMSYINDTDRSFTLTRVLDAPRERVFRAWTDPEHLQWFFSPEKPPTEAIQVDLRVGGTWRQQMLVGQDTEYFTGGIYREIVPVERLVFTWGAVGGWPAIDPERPEESPVVTVLLNETGDKTEMVFHVSLPAHLSEQDVREWLAMGIREGWGDTIDRLAAKFVGAHMPR